MIKILTEIIIILDLFNHKNHQPAIIIKKQVDQIEKDQQIKILLI